MTRWTVAPDCTVERDQYGIRIGTDMSMNGLDCYATIRTVQDVDALIVVLMGLFPPDARRQADAAAERTGEATP